MHSVERLHGNSPTDIELIFVLEEPFGLVQLGKKYFPIWSNIKLKKICLKFEKMTFYIMILAMFNFIVIMPLPADMGIGLGLPGTYKIILQRQKFPQLSSKFTT